MFSPADMRYCVFSQVFFMGEWEHINALAWFQTPPKPHPKHVLYLAFEELWLDVIDKESLREQQ